MHSCIDINIQSQTLKTLHSSYIVYNTLYKQSYKPDTWVTQKASYLTACEQHCCPVTCPRPERYNMALSMNKVKLYSLKPAAQGGDRPADFANNNKALSSTVVLLVVLLIAGHLSNSCSCNIVDMNYTSLVTPSYSHCTSLTGSIPCHTCTLNPKP